MAGMAERGIFAMKILIVKPGGIGDTLLMFPALVELGVRFPGAQIDMIGNRAALELFRISGRIANARSIDDRLSTRLLCAADREAVDILGSYDRLFFLIDDGDGEIAHRLTAAGIRNFVIASSRQADPRVPQWRYCIEICGLRQTLSEDDYCREFARGIPPPAQRGGGVIIHPGSGSATKNWPPERFCAVIDYCCSNLREPIALVMGYAEDGLHAAFERMRHHPRISFFVDCPLAEVVSLLRGARAFLGNDSGIAHVAGLLGVPSVVLFGPTDPAAWKPIGGSVTVLAPPDGERSSNGIATDAVIAALHCALGMEYGP